MTCTWHAGDKSLPKLNYEAANNTFMATVDSKYTKGSTFPQPWSLWGAVNTGHCYLCIRGCVPCLLTEQLPCRLHTGQGFKRLSFSSAPLQASLMGLDIQVMDFTSCTLDLGADVVTLGKWWMWEWGSLRTSCKTKKNMKRHKPASNATVTTC